MKNKIALIFILLCILSLRNQANVYHSALIPFPQKIEWNNQKFQLNGLINFSYSLATNNISVKEIREILTSAGIKDWKETQFEKIKSRTIALHIVADIPGIKINPEEGYKLTVDNDSVVLIATTPKGIFRGVQTIRQLIVTEKNHRYFTGCSITDYPAFSMRGFMLDVGRNYMSLPMLKEQIDILAAYKFNVFHFHLTDNPGWRLESLKYPELKDSKSMSRWLGKYYSQNEFKELVKYCNERDITLIPEFDIPGHCEAFRKAFTLDSMSDPRVQPILLDLIDELCDMVPSDKMPFVHLGTDEVWTKPEYPAPGLFATLMERLHLHNREVIVWRPGQQVDGDLTSITQLWSKNGNPKPGYRYLDSRINYLNHLDPLAGVSQLYFDRICNAGNGDSLRLGGIICCWNDNKVNDEYDILRQNPVYPGLLTYSETSWKGQQTDFGNKYLSVLPSDIQLLKEFKDFENRLICHRDLYFRGKPFPYVKQSQIVWTIIGPFDNKGDVNRKFSVEEDADRMSYTVDGKVFRWTGPYVGGTIHIRHFSGFPSYTTEEKGTIYAKTYIKSPKDQEVGCWIGFQDWSRSGGRRGGPFPKQGQWHTTNPKIWVNEKQIEPPVWKNPDLAENTVEIPFVDENYFFREPQKIHLKKGWNKVVLKVPQAGLSWKWMFTFVPVSVDGKNVKEVGKLKYCAERNQ